MLSSIFLKRPKIFNQELHNYCIKSTNESIRKIIEKNEKERKLPKLKLNSIDDIPSSLEPNGNIILASIFFLSIASFINLFLYNSKR